MTFRYACAWVPRFAATALMRLDARLAGRPVAALIGTEATRTVLEASAEARALGVRPGMPAGEAQTRAPGLVCRDRDPEAERSATAALLDVAGATSPRVEVAAPDRLHLDLSGLAGLFGDETGIGTRLADGLASVGLPARVGIAASRTAAYLAARAGAGVTVVPPGDEALALAPLPIGLLEPAAELALCLDRWGIRTLGALAALPRAALLARLGPGAARLQRLACGGDDGPFVPTMVPEPCVEALALDWEVTELEGLLFVCRRLLERLCARLAVREQGTAALDLTLGLAGGGVHARRLPLVAPVRDLETLLRLLRADLDALVLAAPVTSLAVGAAPVGLRPAQPDLFEPRRPSPHELAQTVGRLAALVGRENVGAPAIGDTHRPGAHGVAPFTGTAARTAAAAALALADPATLACRRLTPPRPARVVVEGGAPRHVEAAGAHGEVLGCAGPWRSAGEWWAETAWSREEWDVALADGAVYRLVLDRASGAWAVDAVYD
jgi:protein ImuB